MSAKLKPCPFCGETERLRIISVGSFVGSMPSRPMQVICKHLDCEQVGGPVGYGEYEAIKAWNRRSALHQSTEAGSPHTGGENNG